MPCFSFPGYGRRWFGEHRHQCSFQPSGYFGGLTRVRIFEAKVVFGRFASIVTVLNVPALNALTEHLVHPTSPVLLTKNDPLAFTTKTLIKSGFLIILNLRIGWACFVLKVSNCLLYQKKLWLSASYSEGNWREPATRWYEVSLSKNRYEPLHSGFSFSSIAHHLESSIYDQPAMRLQVGYCLVCLHCAFSGFVLPNSSRVSLIRVWRQVGNVAS